MIGRFFRKLFGARAKASPVPRERVVEASPAMAPIDEPIPAAAMPADVIEDGFYRLVFALPRSDEHAMTIAEQTALRRLRETFGGERFDVASLPRLPAIVPQLMRSLRNDETDSRALAEQIGRDAVLVGEILRVSNSAYFRTSRPVTSLSQAITLLGQAGLRRVVMQLVMRPILRTDTGEVSRQAGDRLWEHAERCARACTFLGAKACDPFEAFLAGLVCQTGAQTILLGLEGRSEAEALPYSRPFVAALAQQIERLSLHAARHWSFPSRVVQALAERADPADAGARTPLGRALLASSRVAMLDVLIEQGRADPESVLLATGHAFSQSQLIASQDDLRADEAAEA